MNGGEVYHIIPQAVQDGKTSLHNRFTILVTGSLDDIERWINAFELIEGV
jgi:hypothetical protein